MIPDPATPPVDSVQQGLGLMRLTNDNWGDPDRDPARLVNTAVDAGVTLIDTAEMYGNEEIVGRAISSLRDRITLCSKFGVYWGDSGRHADWSVRADPETVRSAIEGSLRRLDVEAIDIYYLHHRSDETPIEDTVTAMVALKQAGKIRSLGLSNVTTEDIQRAHAVHPIAAVQQSWSLGERHVECMIPTLTELGITLIAHSPMGHGRLIGEEDSPRARALRQVASDVGASPGQVALAWVHHRGSHSGTPVVPLPGTGSIAHLQSNIAAAGIALSDSNVRLLDAASPQ
jgi:aryl-alcohol dehydrogenase-like predicted oxidoreductase